MGDYKISIIMPAFNAEETIGTAIKSVQSQDSEKWEIIIVDDNSTDATMSIVEKYERKDNRIRLLKNPAKGVSSARNLGLKSARGDFVAFLDSDDFYYPNAVSDRLMRLERNTDILAVYCQTIMVDDRLRPLGSGFKKKGIITFKDMYRVPFHLNSLMMRRSALQGVKFDENVTNGEDWLFIQRIARMGIKFYPVTTCKTAYRQRNKSTIQKDFIKHENSLINVLATIYGNDPLCPLPSDNYLNGLKTPPLKNIVLKRRFGLIIYLLLNRLEDDAVKVISEFEPRDWNLLGPVTMARTIKNTIIRFTLCGDSRWLKAYRGYLPFIKAFFEKHLPSQSYPKMGKILFWCIENLDKIDWLISIKKIHWKPNLIFN